MASTAAQFDGVLEVPEEDQFAYVQASYRDYLRTWIRL